MNILILFHFYLKTEQNRTEQNIPLLLHQTNVFHRKQFRQEVFQPDDVSVLLIWFLLSFSTLCCCCCLTNFLDTVRKTCLAEKSGSVTNT